MRLDNKQLGSPYIEYTDTKANIEALSNILEGAIAYATDTDELGTYDGAAWQWANANRIKGIDVDDTDIANGKILVYNSTSGNLEYETQGTSNFVALATMEWMQL